MECRYFAKPLALAVIVPADTPAIRQTTNNK